MSSPLQRELLDARLAAVRERLDPDEVVAVAAMRGVEVEALVLADRLGAAELGPALDRAGHAVRGAVHGGLEARRRGHQVEPPAWDRVAGVEVEPHARLAARPGLVLVGLGLPVGGPLPID